MSRTVRLCYKKHEPEKCSRSEHFFGFNVLGFKLKNRLKEELENKVIG